MIAFSKLGNPHVAVPRTKSNYDPAQIAVMDAADAAILAAGHAKKNSGDCEQVCDFRHSSGGPAGEC